jgi:plastocyanin
MAQAYRIRCVAITAIALTVATGGCSRGGAATRSRGETCSGGQVQPAMNIASTVGNDSRPGGSGSSNPAATAAAPAVSAASNQVTIDNFSFTPQTLTVPVGTTVTWTNRDDVPHSATSTEKRFNSGLLDTDEKFSFTFNAAGEYPYFCGIHPHMTGKIIVR